MSLDEEIQWKEQYFTELLHEFIAKLNTHKVLGCIFDTSRIQTQV